MTRKPLFFIKQDFTIQRLVRELEKNKEASKKEFEELEKKWKAKHENIWDQIIDRLIEFDKIKKNTRLKDISLQISDGVIFELEKDDDSSLRDTIKRFFT